MKADNTRTLVLRLFFASGCSGLMYQVVWLRMLARLFGVTIYATSTVVAAFMAGLALGSYIFGKRIDGSRAPLKVYATLEILIAGSAALVPVLLALGLPLVQTVARVSEGNTVLIAAVRVVLAFAILLIPTTLMGGTLPVLTSFLTRNRALFGQSFAQLYSLNTAGAVLGVIVSGFVTIGTLGERATVAIAAGVNLLVGLVAMLLARRLGPVDATEEARATGEATSAAADPSKRLGGLVLTAFAVSGFTALAYEIIWTRQLILFLRTSIYAFAGMLAVFLLGIGGGSLLISRRVDRLRAPLAVFGLLELAVAAVSVLSLLAYAPLDGSRAALLFGNLRPLVATVLLVLPLTLLFGMITPVAAVCFASHGGSSGNTVGRVYSINTLGSILGALAAGFLLVPVLGATRTVVLLATLNLGLALILLHRGWPEGWGRRAALAAVAGLVLALGVFSTRQDPFRSAIETRIARGVGSNALPDSNAALPLSHRIGYYHEGLEATITAFEVNRYKQLWVNGVGMTVLTTATKLMAHLPVLLADDPRDMLVVAFGMGTTVRSASRHPDLRVTAVDIVPETFKTFAFYHADAESVLQSGRVHTVANDGRNFLLLSPRRYDVITVDPAPPIWSAGTVNLYTREFLALARSRLTPGGVMCLWFPGGTEVEVKSLLATFVSVFPNATVWDGPGGWGWYLIGTQKPPDLTRFGQRLRTALQDSELAADLTEFDSLAATPERVEALRRWDAREVLAVTAGSRLITDDYPLTEFPLWRYVRGQWRTWHPPRLEPPR